MAFENYNFFEQVAPAGQDIYYVSALLFACYPWKMTGSLRCVPSCTAGLTNSASASSTTYALP